MPRFINAGKKYNEKKKGHQNCPFGYFACACVAAPQLHAFIAWPRDAYVVVSWTAEKARGRRLSQGERSLMSSSRGDKRIIIFEPRAVDFPFETRFRISFEIQPSEILCRNTQD